MSIWSAIKDAYGWVDDRLGGVLPGGDPPMVKGGFTSDGTPTVGGTTLTGAPVAPGGGAPPGIGMGGMGITPMPSFRSLPAGVTGIGGGGAGGGGDPTAGLSGWEKAAIAAQLAGAGAGIYGAYKQGKLMDEERERRIEEEERKKRAARAFAPILQDLMADYRSNY